MGQAIRSNSLFRRWLMFAGLIVAAGWAAASYWPESAEKVLERLLGIGGVEWPQTGVESPPSDEERARIVQDRLRSRLAVLDAQRRDLAGRIRLLQASSTVHSTPGRTLEDETKRLEQRNSYARQLAEIESQIEALQRILERVDRLVRQQEFDATVERADHAILLEATELLWIHDQGRRGPNAVIPDAAWQQH